MMGVDETVQQLERLYRAVTGKPLPQEEHASTPMSHGNQGHEDEAARQVQEQIDRLLLLLGGPLPPPERLAWIPRASLWEGKSEVLIQVELAGVPRDGLTVAAAHGVLTVSGSRPFPADNAERPALRASELPMGAFNRSFILPPGTNPNEVEARLRDGLLEIRIRRQPSTPENGAQSQSIRVG